MTQVDMMFGGLVLFQNIGEKEIRSKDERERIKKISFGGEKIYYLLYKFIVEYFSKKFLNIFL